MRGWGLGLILAAALSSSPVMAQEGGGASPSSATEPVDLVAQDTAMLINGGTWTFTAPRNAPKGAPQCTETWTFRADGSMTVISAAQTVEQTWRIAEVDGFRLLHTTALSSTNGKDCMGVRANPNDYPKPESIGPTFLFFQGGKNGLVCSPAYVREKDGSLAPLYDEESCWGSLTPATPAR